MSSHTHPFSIVERIKQEGPVDLETYMGWCLETYYETQESLGSEGDFITAPELTPLFGLTVAEWVAAELFRMRDKKHIKLVELGPGRGLLMLDVMRGVQSILMDQAVFQKAPDLQVVLIERSSKLKKLQLETLKELNVLYLDHLDELDVAADEGVIFLANEFFDAFPIQQYKLEEGKLFKRYVGWEEGRLAYLDFPAEENPELLGQIEPNKVYETCPQGVAYFQKVIHCMGRNQSALLMIDYGYWEGQGDTLQAVKNHAYVDPLAFSGTADLTAHVRFSDYAAHVPPNLEKSYTTQGAFLKKWGAETLISALSDVAPPALKEQLTLVYQRLAGKETGQMGDLFKVLEVRYP